MDPKEILKKVRSIQIKASRMVDDVLAGEYSSVFKGRGMEFDEVRQYVPGDEIRTIDWNVTARTGIPHVKRFVKKRAVVFLVSDFLAESMSFEKPLKLAGRRHDLITITVTDPREVELPSLGLVELEDIETGEAMVIDSASLRIRSGYRDRGKKAM